MSSLFLTALLLGPLADVEARTITVSLTDERGAALEGLAREDVALLENGVARDVAGFAPDRRPLTAAFLLDSSEAVRSSYRLHLVEAVTAFVSGLPEGSRFALWTVGERPTKRVDFTDDVKTVRQALLRVVPAGGSTLLDALLEATKDLRKKEGERSAVVVLSAVGPEFSSAHRERVAAEALSADTTFVSVLLQEGVTDFENRASYDYVLDRLGRSSGGDLETALSPMGVGKALQGLLGILKGQYRLTYATVSELEERKLELKVARPGAKVRLASVPKQKKR